MSSVSSNDPAAWEIAPYPWRETQRLARDLGLPLVAAMVLAGRGLTDTAAARAFLECTLPVPDPFLFEHMEGAVSTISDAIDGGRRIVIHGDYDADGVTATALMLLGLRDLGAEPAWYLPSRFQEGYGLSRQAVEAIAKEGPGVLVTVDCGVNYPDEVALARDLGLDVVVVDHHQPGPRLPDCHLIHSAVGRYPHGDLCGVGLALKVMHAVHVRRRAAQRDALPEPLDKLLDLVAIGTIADLAALHGENRYYVREGLKLIGIGQRVGLRALASVAACTGIVDSSTVAFRLAPRLNAAGRLADPSPPLRLLLTDDEEEARDLAATLHELNGARQDVERQIFDEAVAMVEAIEELPLAIVLAGEGWHEGVVGIVASRLVERYHRPAILLGIREGVAKGSGRSIGTYDLMGALNACADVLTVYGGHTQAVGLTLEAERVSEFRRTIEQHAALSLQSGDLVPTYHADAVLRGDDINADTALALASLGPFGSGNPIPRLLLVDADVRDAEATRNGAHLRCTVDVDGVKTRGIGFGFGGIAPAVRADPRRRMLGVRLRVDEWQGVLRPEFQIEQIGSDAKEAEPIRECGGTCLHAALEGPGAAESATTRGEPSNQPVPQMPRANDGRGRPGRFGSLAQVLAAGERTVVVTCSVGHAFPDPQQRVALGWISGEGTKCLGRACAGAERERLAASRVVLVEWEALASAAPIVGPRSHVIAIDPPFRRSHVVALRRHADEDSTIHLFYGDDERQATAQLLRYLVHPRFAMVCLYRALEPSGGDVEQTFVRAAGIAWREARVALTHSDLVRARRILTGLGVERQVPGEAKLDAGNVAAYVAAEAEYKECMRLCLTL